MRVAKSAVGLPDITLQDLGTLDVASAHRAFETVPWAENLRWAKQLKADRQQCVNPDITFGIAPAHIILKLNDDATTFAVEVCVPRVRKILGIIGGVKFYEIPAISVAQCHDAIDSFFNASAADQHIYFERLGASTV
jgi:hypothetical protein